MENDTRVRAVCLFCVFVVADTVHVRPGVIRCHPPPSMSYPSCKSGSWKGVNHAFVMSMLFFFVWRFLFPRLALSGVRLFSFNERACVCDRGSVYYPCPYRCIVLLLC